jgi:O-antigen ligase
MEKIIQISIISLFFPVWIQFQGKDAITTGSIALSITFFFYYVYALITKKAEFRFMVSCVILALITTISTFAVSSQYLGPSLRGSVQFVCALLGFLFIVNYYMGLDTKERLDRIEHLITVIIFLFVAQVILASILYFYSDFGLVLSVFKTRTEDVFITRVASGVKRLRGIIVAQETFGEIMAMLAPLVLYKVIKRGWLYYVVFAVFSFGVLLSATRLSIVLFFVSSLLFSLMNFKLIPFRAWLISLYTIILCIINYFIYFPHALDPILGRFSEFMDIYENTGSILLAMGRKEIWDIGVHEIVSGINLFGHGMITVINKQQFYLHNLYLTVLFQLGIVGFVAFFAIIARILIALIFAIKKVSDPLKVTLLTSSIMSLCIFLLSELKCEFNRGSSYQQVIWIMLGIFYLIAKTLPQLYLKERSR